jgi:hypothetical protein
MGNLTRLVWICILVAGLGASAVPASAQNEPAPEAVQAAKELFSLVSGPMLNELTGRITSQVWPSLESTIRARNAAIDAATMNELRQEFERVQTTYVAEILDEAPAVYARYFTAQELRDIVAFYHTPLGAKTLKVMPQATADLFALIVPKLQGLDQKIGLAFQTILEKRGLNAK